MKTIEGRYFDADREEQIRSVLDLHHIKTKGSITFYGPDFDEWVEIDEDDIQGLLAEIDRLREGKA